MAASIRNLAPWKIAKYGNFSRFTGRRFQLHCSTSSNDGSGGGEASVTMENLKDIDNIIRDINKDLPVPDMTNPYEREKRICVLCKYGIQLNYKNAKLLSQFVSPITGKIYSKHITGLCKAQYARLESCVRMSQHTGYMPYMHKDLDFIHDSKIIVDTRNK